MSCRRLVWSLSSLSRRSLACMLCSKAINACADSVLRAVADCGHFVVVKKFMLEVAGLLVYADAAARGGPCSLKLSC